MLPAPQGRLDALLYACKVLWSSQGASLTPSQQPAELLPATRRHGPYLRLRNRLPQAIRRARRVDMPDAIKSFSITCWSSVWITSSSSANGTCAAFYRAIFNTTMNPNASLPRQTLMRLWEPKSENICSIWALALFWSFSDMSGRFCCDARPRP